MIADGHHRYETALRYKMNRLPETTEPAASDYALAYFSNMADPGLAIYGTHRLVAGLDPERMAALPRVARGHVRGGTARGREPRRGGARAGHRRRISKVIRGERSDSGATVSMEPTASSLTDPEAARSGRPGAQRRLPGCWTSPSSRR